MFHYQPHKTFISFFIKTMNYKSHQEFSPLNSMNSIGRSLNTHQDLMRTTSSNTRALNCWSHWIPAPTRSIVSEFSSHDSHREGFKKLSYRPFFIYTRQRPELASNKRCHKSVFELLHWKSTLHSEHETREIIG